MSGFDVQPLRINNASATLYSMSLELGDAIGLLRMTLEFELCGSGGGPPWGTDEVGAEFGRLYTETAAVALPAIESCRDQIEGGAWNLADASRNFQSLNEVGAVNLAELRRSLRGEV